MANKNTTAATTSPPLEMPFEFSPSAPTSWRGSEPKPIKGDTGLSGSTSALSSRSIEASFTKYEPESDIYVLERVPAKLIGISPDKRSAYIRFNRENKTFKYYIPVSSLKNYGIFNPMEGDEYEFRVYKSPSGFFGRFSRREQAFDQFEEVEIFTPELIQDIEKDLKTRKRKTG